MQCCSLTNTILHSRRNRSNTMVLKSPQSSNCHSKRYFYPYSSNIAFLARQPLPSPSSVFAKADELLNPVRNVSPPDEWIHWTCPTCVDSQTKEPFTCIGGEKEWKNHLRSRRHKAQERRMKNKINWEAWKICKAQEEGVVDTSPDVQQLDTLELR
jgi:hypothetical protein